MKLNRTLVIGGITGGIILIISSYLLFRGDTNETNTGSSPDFTAKLKTNVKGDYITYFTDDGKKRIAPVFGGNKKRNTKKRNTKKYNRTINKNNKK
jgi:hypothetical protein